MKVKWSYKDIFMESKTFRVLIQDGCVGRSWGPLLPQKHRIYSYRWNNSLLRKPKVWLSDDHISGEQEKKNYTKVGRRGWTQFHNKPQLWWSILQTGGSSNPRVSPWGAKGLSPTWGIPPRDEPPKYLTLKAIRTHYPVICEGSHFACPETSTRGASFRFGTHLVAHGAVLKEHGLWMHGGLLPLPSSAHHYHPERSLCTCGEPH